MEKIAIDRIKASEDKLAKMMGVFNLGQEQGYILGYNQALQDIENVKAEAKSKQEKPKEKK